MVKWELDKETSTDMPEIKKYISKLCERLSKEIDTVCHDHILVCSGGPWRDQDVKIGYTLDAKKFHVDFYSYLRNDSDREEPAVDYAKGIMLETCIHRGYLEKKYPNEWREKYQEWRAGMWKLAGQEQKDYLRQLRGEKNESSIGMRIFNHGYEHVRQHMGEDE